MVHQRRHPQCAGAPLSLHRKNNAAEAASAAAAVVSDQKVVPSKKIKEIPEYIGGRSDEDVSLDETACAGPKPAGGVFSTQGKPDQQQQKQDHHHHHQQKQRIPRTPWTPRTPQQKDQKAELEQAVDGQKNPVRELPEGMVWLKTLKTGMPFYGGVKSVTNFGVFLECGIVRPGRKGTVTRVQGMLHKTDLAPSMKVPFQYRPKATKVLEKGMTVKCYVKAVFPQSGRFSLTMDPTITRAKLREQRQRRKQGLKVRYSASEMKAWEPEVEEVKEANPGDVMEGTCKCVKNFGMYFDIGVEKSALLKASDLPEDMQLEDGEASERQQRLEEFCPVGSTMKLEVLSNDGRLILLKPKPTQ